LILIDLCVCQITYSSLESRKPNTTTTTTSLKSSDLSTSPRTLYQLFKSYSVDEPNTGIILDLLNLDKKKRFLLTVEFI